MEISISADMIRTCLRVFIQGNESRRRSRFLVLLAGFGIDGKVRVVRRPFGDLAGIDGDPLAAWIDRDLHVVHRTRGRAEDPDTGRSVRRAVTGAAEPSLDGLARVWVDEDEVIAPGH